LLPLILATISPRKPDSDSSVILDHLREIGRHTGNRGQAVGHAGQQRLLVGKAPLRAGLEINQRLQIVGAFRIGAVIRAAGLAMMCATSG
jgi:hypothetical protein